MADPNIQVLTAADAEIWLNGAEMLNTLTRAAKRSPYRVARFNFVGNPGTHKSRVVVDEALDLDAVYQRNSAPFRVLLELITRANRRDDVAAVFGYPDIQVGGYAESACYVLANPSRDIMFDDVHRGTWGFEPAGFFSDGEVVAPTMAAGDHPFEETGSAKFLTTNIAGRGGNTDSAVSTFDKTDGQTMMVARILSRSGTAAGPAATTINWNGQAAADGFVRVMHGTQTLAFPVSQAFPVADVYNGFRSLEFDDGYRINPTINRSPGTGNVASVRLEGSLAGDTESFQLLATSIAPFNTGSTYTGTGDRLEAQLIVAPATGNQRVAAGPIFHIDQEQDPPFNVFIPVPDDVARAGLRFITPTRQPSQPVYNIAVQHALVAI